MVRVPGSVSRLLKVASSRQQPTRLKLRVLAGKFSKFTPRRLSPVVTGIGDGGPGGPGPGAAACPGNDYDNDLLSNAREVELNLDPCLADTDGDSVEDGYEYQSALDLNHYPRTAPLPYPGKRPYPNALDPSDGKPGGTRTTTATAWSCARSSSSGSGTRPMALPGRRRRPVAAPATATLLYSRACRSRSTPAPASSYPRRARWRPWALDINEDGVLRDDERDADADGLGNWDELRGRMTEAWWSEQHDGDTEPKESKYPTWTSSTTRTRHPRTRMSIRTWMGTASVTARTTGPRRALERSS